MTTYETKVLFMHKDKKEGKYMFIFNDEEKTLGNGVKSLLMNVSDIKELIDGSAVVGNTGKSRYVKVSVMVPKEEEGKRRHKNDTK